MAGPRACASGVADAPATGAGASEHGAVVGPAPGARSCGARDPETCNISFPDAQVLEMHCLTQLI
jgi:hypothetical protein